jgi:hypothetical protein
MIEKTPGASNTRPSSAARAPGAKRTKDAGDVKSPGDAPEPGSDGSADIDSAAIERQRMQFDMIVKYNAEMERELNLLRDMMLEQMKKDDEFTKEMIRLI